MQRRAHKWLCVLSGQLSMRLSVIANSWRQGNYDQESVRDYDSHVRSQNEDRD